MADNGMVHDYYNHIGINNWYYCKYSARMADLGLFQNAIAGNGTDMRSIYAVVVFYRFSCYYGQQAVQYSV